MHRRKAISTLGAGIAASNLAAQQSAKPSGEVPMRTLGHTNEKVSPIGLGGHHIARGKDKQLAIRLVRHAVDNGINFMDNCWDYHDGISEEWMGEALKDGYRNKVFLMSKFDGRTKASTARQIDESLRRLQSDRLDLMQYHENIRMEDPDRFFASNGPLEALLEAKKAGKIRYIGFTGHKDPVVHVRMLEVAAQNKFLFDACQMPLNPMDAHFRSFEKGVLPQLTAAKIGVLGMKPMGDGLLLKSGAVKPVECLHYALSLPTSVVITGCERMELLDQAIDAARTFKPLSSEQKQELLARAKEPAMTGKWELFKTSDRFDGTAKNPHWMS